MERDELIAMYFELGLLYKNIVGILAVNHGIRLSFRHLKRILNRLRLKRREYDDLDHVVNFIRNILRSSGRQHGYRMMYVRCHRNGIKVRMEHVRFILQVLDPEGVQLRRSRRLNRREYFSKGPNYLWHLDGYDKLKRFGLCIHGCICGFSRYIVWLNVYRTNNDPKIIGGYFLESIQRENGVPKIVRGDYGTENVVVREIQLFLRQGHTDEMSHAPYIGGASTSNQRIEQWWGYLRKESSNFWIELFKGMEERGEFDGGFVHRNLVQFCFMSIIQDELDTVGEMWNAHTIRPSRNQNIPYGKPNVMYLTPSLWGAEEQMCPVAQGDVDQCKTKVELRSLVPCDQDVYNLSMYVMRRDGLLPPRNATAAVDLYNHLRGEMSVMLQ